MNSNSLSATANNLWEFLCSSITCPGEHVAWTVEGIAEQRAWPMGVVRRALDELVSAGLLVENEGTWSLTNTS